MIKPEVLPAIIASRPLEIRTWRHDDAEPMTEMITASLDHLRPWMAWARSEPLSPDDRCRQISRWSRYRKSGRGAVYGVFEDGLPIGGCGLHRRVGPGGLDIGYWLSAAHTGQGHATRIAEALTATACAEPGGTFAQISHDARNTASAAVARRLRYTDQGTIDRGPVQVQTWRRDC